MKKRISAATLTASALALGGTAFVATSFNTPADKENRLRYIRHYNILMNLFKKAGTADIYSTQFRSEFDVTFRSKNNRTVQMTEAQVLAEIAKSTREIPILPEDYRIRLKNSQDIWALSYGAYRTAAADYAKDGKPKAWVSKSHAYDGSYPGSDAAKNMPANPYAYRRRSGRVEPGQ